MDHVPVSEFVNKHNIKIKFDDSMTVVTGEHNATTPTMEKNTNAITDDNIVVSPNKIGVILNLQQIIDIMNTGICCNTPIRLLSFRFWRN